MTSFIDHAVLPEPYVGQLETDAPTEGADCGVRSLINLVLASSGNKVGPKDAKGQKRWTAAVRRWMQVPTGATTPADWMRAWSHPNLTKLFARAGLVKPKATRYDNARQSLILEGLAEGRTFEVGVNYGVLRGEGGPMGSTSFNGGHAIAFTGIEKHGDHTDVVDLDPLFDGRRGDYPHGPIRWRWDDYKEAMARFGSVPPGPGRFDGISVPKARAK